MELAPAAVLLAPGLALGSFLNVVASRVPLRRSVVHPRSACMSCETPIAGRDNIPLVSYALLRGRCRNCKERIPLRYPAVELVTALLVAGTVLRFGVTWRALVEAVFCVALVAIAATDLEAMVIPNRIVVPATVVVLAGNTIVERSPEYAIAAAVSFAVLLTIALIVPKGMGMGDVKLAALLGAGLGRTVSVAFMIGILTALVPSAVLFARHGSKARTMKIPLGVFLAIGGVIAVFAGQEILDAYWKLFR